MKLKLIYISGKMGEKRLSKQTKLKFAKAEEKLLNEGWVVINPARDNYQKETQHHVSIEEKKWQDLDFGKFDWYAWMLLWDMHSLALCDSIYMLADWQDSPGATVEHTFATATKKEIIYQDLATKP